MQHVDYIHLFSTNEKINIPLDKIIAKVILRGIQDKLSSYDAQTKSVLEPLLTTFKKSKILSLSQLITDIIYACDQAHLSDTQKDAIFNFSIDNNTFLEALYKANAIDTAQYQSILKEPYAKWPTAVSHIFGMLFTQEVFDECKDGLLAVQESSDAMQNFM